MATKKILLLLGLVLCCLPALALAEIVQIDVVAPLPLAVDAPTFDCQCGPGCKCAAGECGDKSCCTRSKHCTPQSCGPNGCGPQRPTGCAGCKPRAKRGCGAGGCTRRGGIFRGLFRRR